MKAFLCAIALAIGVFAFSLAHAAQQLWTCGMHPQVIKTEPGNCPICGMKLVPIKGSAGDAAKGTGGRQIKYYKSTMNPGEVSPKPGKDSMGMDMVPVYEEGASTEQNRIQIDSATIQRMNLRTALVEHGPVRREIRTVGTVAYNEQGLRDITTKYEGWLERVFVNTLWTPVKAGDPLFEIYSPDLFNAELNLIVARQTEGQNGGPLTRAAIGRLQLFDVPNEFVTELARTGKAQRTFTFRAPADGVVIEKMGVVGQMMKPGERVYRLADLSSVWVQAQIYENDLPFLHNGDNAVITTSYGPERRFEGTVQLLVPQVEEQTRSVTARIVLPNPDGFLRPGMYVEVKFASQISPDAVLVPDMAVLRSGERNTVFVALPDGYFEPREVRLGARSSGGFYQVLSGVNAGERIVTSGQFMLDSESQLREAIQKMLKPEGAAPASMTRAPADGATAMPAATASEALQILARAAADAAVPLANDDFAGYQKELPPLRAALSGYFSAEPHAAHGPLAKFQNSPAEPADLKAARAGFAPLSTAVCDAVRDGSFVTVPGLHVFDCPMAKARWLQRDAVTKNPFYGGKMPTCGDEVATPRQ